MKHSASHKAPRHTLIPNHEKILEAVIFLLNEAEKKGEELTQYEIVKSIFLADRSHLNNYGRPITFDNYVAMRHGPVGRTVYDLLKGSRSILDKFGLEVPLWTTSKAPKISKTAKLYTHPTRQADEDILSPSDMEALRNALGMVLSLTFSQLRKLTHDDPAYAEAWDEDGDASAYDMSLGMLFDGNDFEQAAHLEFASQHK